MQTDRNVPARRPDAASPAAGREKRGCPMPAVRCGRFAACVVRIYVKVPPSGAARASGPDGFLRLGSTPAGCRFLPKCRGGAGAAGPFLPTG